jgi:L-alanine-DL-glutamate epimerase-like enolase superfamily enzyme
MKILDVRTTLLTGPSTNDPFLREARKLRSAAFIELLTEGPTGIGETYAGYYLPEAVPTIVDFFKPILIGQTVEDIEGLWRRMYHCGNFWCRVGLGAIVLAGIEAALWDLKGKVLGQPVHVLLGGAKHDRLRCYATGGPSNYPKDRLAAKLDHYFSLGFRGAKVGAGCYRTDNGWYMPGSAREAADFEGDKAAFMRKHCGDEAWLMMDGHMGNNHEATWDLDVATAVMRAVDPAGLFFFEEPLHYTNATGYRELCQRSQVPIAGGECLTAACEWEPFVLGDCFDIGQPDASFAGGLAEFLRIAAMFQARGRKIATHAWGAGASLMQNVHAGFVAETTTILEIPPDCGPLHSEMIDGGLVIRDGYALPPDRPGLGIVLTDETRRRFPFRPGSGEFNSVPGKILKD